MKVFFTLFLLSVSTIGIAQPLHVELDHRPEPIDGITAALETRTFYVDVIASNEHQSINPLRTVTLTHSLLFIDGDSPAQQQWLQDQWQQTPNAIVILVKGAPFLLSQQWQRTVYFDQGGNLTERLSIQHVPARVIQVGQQLQVTEEVAL